MSNVMDRTLDHLGRKLNVDGTIGLFALLAVMTGAAILAISVKAAYDINAS